MSTRQCFKCGGQIESDDSPNDFCRACTEQIRSENSLSFQVMEALRRIHSRRRIPLITILLCALNVALYCVIASNAIRGLGLEASLGMNDAAIARGEFWRLLTYGFVQVRFPHLAENVLFLCILGTIAEPLFGRARLLLIWFATAIAGSIAGVLFARSAFIFYGSSCVVTGLTGALLSVYLFRDVGMSRRSRTIRILALAGFALFRVVGEWFLLGALNPGHTGGLIAGLALGLFVPPKETWDSHPPEAG